LILDVAGVAVNAQVSTASTRFTVAVAPMYAQPKGEFHGNVRRGFGGGGACSTVSANPVSQLAA
jgi:hypothetical protein